MFVLKGQITQIIVWIYVCIQSWMLVRSGVSEDSLSSELEQN